MRFVVLGAGALGAVIAGHLAKAGENVVLIARGERGKYLKEHGITITGLSEFTIPCTVVTDPKEVLEADVLIVTVKTSDMESALAGVKHISVSNVLSVQNGVVKNEQLAGAFGKEKTLGASAFFSAEMMPEGPVNFTMNRCFHIGELPEGTSERVKKIVEIIERSGIHAESTPTIQTIEWSKFIGWLGFMTLSVLTRTETYRFLSDSDTAAIGARVMKEAALVANKLNVPLEDSPPVPVKTIISITEKEAVEKLQEAGAMMKSMAPTHRVSTLQDLERGRPLEVEETLGYIVKKAGEHDVPVPNMEICYRLISGINRFVGDVK
jgi:2-dehydropantoate 2-reductase